MKKKRVVVGSYLQRNIDLTSLGFSSYQAYLSSPLWKSIRARVHQYHGWVCYLCGYPARDLHHLRYHIDILLGSSPSLMEEILPLCRRCHSLVEFKANGQKVKRTLRGAYRKFHLLLLKGKSRRS